MPTLETVSNYYIYTVGLEKAVFSVPPKKIKVSATFAEVMDLEYSKVVLSRVEYLEQSIESGTQALSILSRVWKVVLKL